MSNQEAKKNVPQINDQPPAPIEIESILRDVKPPLTKEQNELLKGVFKVYRQSLIISESHSGPLPKPSDFESYERILSGSAERILSMAEKQSNHRQRMEANIVASGTFVEKLGALSAVCIALVVLIGSILLIAVGKNIYGLVAIISTLASLVTAFVYGKMSSRSKPQDNQVK